MIAKPNPSNASNEMRPSDGCAAVESSCAGLSNFPPVFLMYSLITSNFLSEINNTRVGSSFRVHKIQRVTKANYLFLFIKKNMVAILFLLYCAMTYKITNSHTTQTFLPQVVCRNRPKIQVSTCGRELVQMSCDKNTDVVAGPKKVKIGEESNTVIS